MTPSTPIFSTFCWAWARPANPPPVSAATSSPSASHPAALRNVVMGPSCVRRSPCRYDSVVYNAIGFCVHNLRRNTDGAERHDRPPRLRPHPPGHPRAAAPARHQARRGIPLVALRGEPRTPLIIAVHEGPGSSCCAYDEHRALLAPLEAGRVQDAVDLMTRHLQGIEGRLNLDQTPRTPVDLRDVFGKPARNGLASRRSR